MARHLHSNRAAAQVGAQQVGRVDYDEDQVLTDYIWAYGHQHMNRVELRARQTLLARAKAEIQEPARAEKVRRLLGYEDDPKVAAALAGGVEEFRRVVRDRILRAHPRFAKRCPQCQRVLRTPKAKQCRWCFHDWH